MKQRTANKKVGTPLRRGAHSIQAEKWLSNY